MFVQIHQHILLQPRLSIIDPNAVIVPVETVDEGLDGGFVEVTEVGGALPRFLTEHERLRIDEAEGVDDDFSFHRLNGVDDDGDGAGGELLEGLLRVYVDGGEPAAEARVGVVPAYYCFGPVDERVFISCAQIVRYEITHTVLFAAAYPSSWSGRPDPRLRR